MDRMGPGFSAETSYIRFLVMFAIFLQLLTPRLIGKISSIFFIMFSLNEVCIPIAASLVALIRGREDEKKLMEGFRHEKLNEAYGQALG